MPDPTGLRVIGIGFSAITALVTLIAAFIVVGAGPGMTDSQQSDRPATANVGRR
jgi:hypothetical protein